MSGTPQQLSSILQPTRFDRCLRLGSLDQQPQDDGTLPQQRQRDNLSDEIHVQRKQDAGETDR